LWQWKTMYSDKAVTSGKGPKPNWPITIAISVPGGGPDLANGWPDFRVGPNVSSRSHRQHDSSG
jgi:hypothetical protein